MPPGSNFSNGTLSGGRPPVPPRRGDSMDLIVKKSVTPPPSRQSLQKPMGGGGGGGPFGGYPGGFAPPSTPPPRGAKPLFPAPVNQFPTRNSRSIPELPQSVPPAGLARSQEQLHVSQSGQFQKPVALRAPVSPRGGKRGGGGIGNLPISYLCWSLPQTSTTKLSWSKDPTKTTAGKRD